AYLVGRLWSRQTMRQLRTQRRLVNRAFSGEDIPVELHVANDGWLPVAWVEMHDSLPVDLISPPNYRRVLSLRPHESRRFSYTLTCRKRGYYVIGPMTWRTGDLLGLAPQLAGQQEAEYIIVYPRVLPLQRLGLPTRSPLASIPAPAPLFEDPTRVIGVRGYQRGDSPRRIHWTASASTGTLLVKRYQPAIARETLICLDLAQENYSFQRLHAASELAIVAAASLANHIAVREGLAVGLATQAFDPLEERVLSFSLPPRRGRAYLMGVLEVLARAQTTTASGPDAEGLLPLAGFLRQQGHTLSWGSTMIVITGQETQALDDSLLYLRQQGLAVTLVLIMPPPAGDDVHSRSAALGLPVYTIWREEEVDLL
ncbi:MAG: DUF58 domain-containing protein, partial [Anaerolineae bacterium]|nr:DUF58 domain-containing protein [Anaerolineae bacterium]